MKEGNEVNKMNIELIWELTPLDDVCAGIMGLKLSNGCYIHEMRGVYNMTYNT